MKSKWVREVRELLSSAEFVSWYELYNRVRAGIESARQRRDELLTQANLVRFEAEMIQQNADDMLFLAGEHEDQSARAHAAFAEIENDSFEVLSTFEMQRQKATDTWAELDRVEKLLEDQRAVSSELQGQLAVALKNNSLEGQAEASRLRSRLREVEVEVEAEAADVEDARQRRHSEEERKTELWREVEETWSAAFVANMERTEYSYQARRVRAEAEQLFERAARERRRGVELDAEAQRTVDGVEEALRELDRVVADGRGQFDGVLSREFVFWPNEGDPDTALCVPLIDEPNHFNIQVSALNVYKVDRTRGLELLEPVPEVEEGQDDPRLDAFFLQGRPGL